MTGGSAPAFLFLWWDASLEGACLQRIVAEAYLISRLDYLLILFQKYWNINFGHERIGHMWGNGYSVGLGVEGLAMK